MIFFASGMNHPGEIRGARECIGSHVGTTIEHISKDTPGQKHAASQLAKFPRGIFIDSGAFSEVDKRLRVVNPLGDKFWASVFRTYGHFAFAGERLTIVAPDRIGCQKTSLERLSRYSEQVRSLVSTGARVLVPLQKGELSQAAFFDKARSAAGCEMIPAFPMAKGATSVAEIRRFFESEKVDQVHFLGIGPGSKKLDPVLSAVPGSVRVSADACLLKRYVGRKSGLKPMTAAQDFFSRVIEQSSCEPTRSEFIFMKKRFALEAILWDFWVKHGLVEGNKPKKPEQMKLF